MNNPSKALFATNLSYVAQLAQKCADEQDFFFCEIMLSSNVDEIVEKVRSQGILLVLSHGALADRLRSVLTVTVIEVPVDYIAVFGGVDKLVSLGCKRIFVLLPCVDEMPSRASFFYQDCEVIFVRLSSVNEGKIVIGEAALCGVDGILAPESLINSIPERDSLKALCIGISATAITRMFEAGKRILHLEKVKRLQLTRLDLLINNIAEGVIIFNRDKEAVFHNVQADKILHGVKPEDMFDLLEPFFKDSRVNSVVTLNGRQVLMNTMRFIFPNTDIDNHVVILHEGREIEKSERSLRAHNISKGLIAKSKFAALEASDEKTKALIEQAKRFASTDSTVLICGETGVGKEVFAQSIHNASARKAEAFVSVNCAVLPPALIESELFGYVEGAFTGARSQGKPGLFEMAHRGTIFLDEIGELPSDMQGRLLRVLQEREIMRIGDDRLIPVDVRVICATNRDLQKLCQEDKFRWDLYYRINVLRLSLPALRDRKGDILPLFTAFLGGFFGNHDFTIEDDAKSYLNAYHWPGNIRELRNTAEACVLDGPVIKKSTLEQILHHDPYKSSDLKVTDNAANLSDIHPEGMLNLNLNELASLKDLEYQALQGMLKFMSQDEICRRLNLSRVTLWRKLKKA